MKVKDKPTWNMATVRSPGRASETVRLKTLVPKAAITPSLPWPSFDTGPNTTYF